MTLLGGRLNVLLAMALAALLALGVVSAFAGPAPDDPGDVVTVDTGDGDTEGDTEGGDSGEAVCGVDGDTEGDDVRLIDWNVSARMNSLFVKEYIEERELKINLLVDILYTWLDPRVKYS